MPPALIDIKTNAGRVADALGRMSAKLERVVARGISDTAKAVQAHVTAQLDVRIDKPTPFTKRSYRIAYAPPARSLLVSSPRNFKPPTF